MSVRLLTPTGDLKATLGTLGLLAEKPETAAGKLGEEPPLAGRV